MLKHHVTTAFQFPVLSILIDFPRLRTDSKTSTEYKKGGSVVDQAARYLTLPHGLLGSKIMAETTTTHLKRAALYATMGRGHRNLLTQPNYDCFVLNNLNPAKTLALLKWLLRDSRGRHEINPLSIVFSYFA